MLGDPDPVVVTELVPLSAGSQWQEHGRSSINLAPGGSREWEEVEGNQTVALFTRRTDARVVTLMGRLYSALDPVSAGGLARRPVAALPFIGHEHTVHGS